MSIGVLAHAIMDINDRVSGEATRALRDMLPTLSPAQYGVHDRETVPALCRLLSSYHYHPFLRPSVVEAIGRYRWFEDRGRV